MRLKTLFLIFIGLACTHKIFSQKADTPYTQKTPSIDGTGKVYMGREMAAIQGYEGASWLDRKNRNEEENSLEAIKHFPIKPNSLVADLGAGTGYYSFLLAPKVPKGKIYSIEVEKKYIHFLNSKIEKTHTQNIVPVLGTETNINLPEGQLDLVFMVDVYHELAYPREILHSIRKALKKDGRLLLLEYKAEDPNVPIKELHKMTLNQIDKELNANGFVKESFLDSLPWQHLVIYKKNPSNLR